MKLIIKLILKTARETIVFLFLFYFFVSRHEVYSVNTRCA